MTALRYWKWQTVRNLPLAAAIFVLVAGVGATVVQMLPQQQVAQSRVVLETPLALHDTPRAARSAQDVQHLQVVMHRLADDDGRSTLARSLGIDLIPRTALETRITSGRDKPTNLIIEAHSTTAEAANSLAKAATGLAITISNELQRDLVEASLSNLKALVETQSTALAEAEAKVATIDLSQPGAMSQRLAQLKAQEGEIIAALAGQKRTAPAPNPALVALQKELTSAQAVYSDQHPKMRLLQARIAQITPQTPSTPKDPAPQQRNLDTLRAEMAQLAARQSAQATALEALSDAKTNLGQTKDALIEARLRGERSVARLKLVEDATPLTASRTKKQLAMLLTLALFATALAIAAVVARIKFDPRLRRACDLQRTLGLTPFATIPHLGPKLT